MSQQSVIQVGMAVLELNSKSWFLNLFLCSILCHALYLGQFAGAHIFGYDRL